MAPRKKKADDGKMIDQSRYERISILGKDGTVKHSSGNGDAVAVALLIAMHGQGLDIGKIIKANSTKDNGLAEKYVPEQWDNAGMLRMNVGGTLRAMVRKGEEVVIGDITVKKLDQKVTIPADMRPKAKKAEKEAA